MSARFGWRCARRDDAHLRAVVDVTGLHGAIGLRAAPPDLYLRGGMSAFSSVPRGLPTLRDLAARARAWGPRLPELAADVENLARLLERADADPHAALNKLRYLAEKVLIPLCEDHGVRSGDAQPTLERMIPSALGAGIVPKTVGRHLRTIQTYGSPGSHPNEVTGDDVGLAFLALEALLAWRSQRADPTAGRADEASNDAPGVKAPPAWRRARTWLAPAVVALSLVAFAASRWRLADARSHRAAPRVTSGDARPNAAPSPPRSEPAPAIDPPVEAALARAAPAPTPRRRAAPAAPLVAPALSPPASAPAPSPLLTLPASPPLEPLNHGP